MKYCFSYFLNIYPNFKYLAHFKILMYGMDVGSLTPVFDADIACGPLVFTLMLLL